MNSPIPSMPNLNSQMSQPQTPASHAGRVVVLVAIVLLLVAGGVYYMKFWQNAVMPEAAPSAEVQDQAASATDSPASIDADLGAIENLDINAEFKDIDADAKTL